MKRGLLCVGVGYLLMTLLGSAQRAIGLEQVSIDVALIIVLYLSMAERRGGDFRDAVSLGGAVPLFDGFTTSAVILLGYLADLLGGDTKGIAFFALALVFVISRLLTRQVYLAGIVAQALFSFAASLFASTVALGFRLLMGGTADGPLLAVILGQAVLTALMAPWVMGLIRVLEARLSGRKGERNSHRELIVRR